MKTEAAGKCFSEEIQGMTLCFAPNLDFVERTEEICNLTKMIFLDKVVCSGKRRGREEFEPKVGWAPLRAGGKPLWITSWTVLWQCGRRIRPFVPQKYFLWSKKTICYLVWIFFQISELIIVLYLFDIGHLRKLLLHQGWKRASAGIHAVIGLNKIHTNETEVFLIFKKIPNMFYRLFIFCSVVNFKLSVFLKCVLNSGSILVDIHSRCN